MQYLPVVPSNLYVRNSKPSNEVMFRMLEQLMLQLGLPISSMLGGLFSGEWTPLLIHEKGPVIDFFYQTRRDCLAATVPTDFIGGFHRFILAALARYTAPMISVC